MVSDVCMYVMCVCLFVSELCMYVCNLCFAFIRVGCMIYNVCALVFMYVMYVM